MQHIQHLSDEAVAAFADGVLSGHARERALRHTKACPECNYAVAIQREAVWALRAAPAPALPTGLMDRLRGLPQSTPLDMPPTTFAPDGTPMLSVMAPMAAFVAPTKQPSRVRPLVGAAVAVAAVGVFAAGSGGHVLTGTPSRSPAHTAPLTTTDDLAVFIGHPVRP